MDAIIRWVDGKPGRRALLGRHLNVTRAGISMMLLKGAYLRTQHILPIYELTGIPLRYLVRRADSGLTERELIELDQIARKRELEELEARMKERS